MANDSGVHLNELTTEQVLAVTRDLDCLSPLEIVQAMNAQDATVAGAVRQELPQIDTAVEALREILG